jgi:3-deoxy-D-manno-octulosonic-acid transferase
MIWRILYNLLVVPALKLGLLLVALGSEKVRRGVKGRMGEGDHLRVARSRCEDGTARVLVHCASAGELESAIPIIRELNATQNVCIILSYYSPSALNRVSEIDDIADHIYLPFDSARRVRRMLGILDLSLILVIKHDLWPNLVWESEARGVPVVLANAYSRRDSALIRQRILLPFSRQLHGALAEIHAVADADTRRLRFLSGKRIDVYSTGDTRFDRVRERALTSKRDQGELDKQLAGKRVFVAGSTWPVDEKKFLEAWNDLKAEDRLLLLVPHELHEEHLKQLEHDFAEFDPVRLSALSDDSGSVIIVDKMGILAGLYGLGVGAYVGGGFGVGVHSVIEPAVFGIPVAFGPKFEMSPEAKEQQKRQAAVCVRDASELKEFMRACLDDDESHRDIGRRSAEYVDEKAGCTERLVAQLAKRYLSSSSHQAAPPKA